MMRRSINSLFTPQGWPLAALLISGGMLGGAWFFQYALGFPPCQMCYWQRHVHKAVIGLSLLALLAPRFGIQQYRLMDILIGLAFFVSFAIAFWHVGVEYKWWEGPRSCMAGAPDLSGFDPDTFLDSLSKPQKMPSCTEAVWHFLGLSMAAWNALISALAGLVSIWVALRPSTLEAAND